jgi:hypothetical protein
MSNQPTLSLTQATQRVEQYGRDALAHMPGTPEAGTPNRTSVPSDDPTDGGPKGPVDVGDTYRITYGDPRPDNTEVFNRLHDYWTGQGYQVLKDSRSQPRGRLVRVENPHDGFRMGIEEAAMTPQLTLAVSSPCVWPEGTPQAH